MSVNSFSFIYACACVSIALATLLTPGVIPGLIAVRTAQVTTLLNVCQAQNEAE